jgi:hypothetical protein
MLLLGVAIASTFHELNALAANSLLGTDIDLRQQRGSVGDRE